jgi:cellulose synthase/poly-beta-1,6-N-acetylglucosamine synthase-like glycosyltransferase
LAKRPVAADSKTLVASAASKQSTLQRLAPPPTVSVVVPCYSEQETLPAFADRMTAACRAVPAFFGVGQFFCIAIVGAYLGRIYMQVKGRPLSLIDEIVTAERREPQYG